MREFLLTVLENLKRNTGLLQYEKLLALEEEEATREINLLLDSLMAACRQFPMIDVTRKKKIISDNILSDNKLMGLYPNKLIQWFQTEWSSYDSAKRQKLVNKLHSRNITFELNAEHLDAEESQKYIDKMKKIVDEAQDPRQTTPSERLKQRGLEEAVEYKTTLIDCPICNNDPHLKKYCGYCAGAGQLKTSKKIS